MTLVFSKYSGSGNDFVVVDNRSGSFSVDRVPSLCHRQLGIGADGVILLEKSTAADFKMRIFNADGSEAEMCGNGMRCLTKFIQELGLLKSACMIETMHRKHQVSLKGDLVSVAMGEPVNMHWNLPLAIDGDNYLMQCLDTGVPHAILFVADIEAIDIKTLGRSIRFHPFFGKEGSNANVASLDAKGQVSLRTYERGVEDETLSCGTGATAAAIAAAKIYHIPPPISVRIRSQDILTIDFTIKGQKIENVTMTGPAVCIFRGTME